MLTNFLTHLPGMSKDADLSHTMDAMDGETWIQFCRQVLNPAQIMLPFFNLFDNMSLNNLDHKVKLSSSATDVCVFTSCNVTYKLNYSRHLTRAHLSKEGESFAKRTTQYIYAVRNAIGRCLYNMLMS